MRDDSTVEMSSGNVFADAGLPEPDRLLAKAKLTARIQSLLRERALTDAEAAARMEIGASELSHLLGGGFDDFTFDQIFHYLNRLGLDIEVHTRAQSPSCADAALTVIAA